MRLIRGLTGMLVMAVALNACFKPPEFSIIPEIEFSNISFKKGPPPSTDYPSPADTLILWVKFKDGDGDLGLDGSETGIPYNDRFYFVFPDGSFLNYRDKFKVPGYDTLPAFVPPYNCTNWEQIRDPNTHVVTDTLYFQLNPNQFNFFVDFYIQQNDTTFALYDWKKEFVWPNCYVSGFNGRFPILSKDLTQKTAQEGTIRYNMKSVAFNILFSIKVMKLRLYIKDRALHKSNVIETPTFTLQSILNR
jgi:hypothetical protein